MLGTTWLKPAAARRVCVAGLDVGWADVHWVVLAGTAAQAERVCSAERLNLPVGWVVDGEVREFEALGQWLRAYLQRGEDLPDRVYVGIDRTGISQHRVSLPMGLSSDDVMFQLQAEVQFLQPHAGGEVCIDYAVDSENTETGEQLYDVHTTSQLRVEAVKTLAKASGMSLMAVEPREEAKRRSEINNARFGLPHVQPTSALSQALPQVEALGLALRAWDDTGLNFLPHRANAQQAFRRKGWVGLAISGVCGMLLALACAWGMAWVAEHDRLPTAEVQASARTWDEVRLAHEKAIALQDRQAEQNRWVTSRLGLQSQSLQWGRVLSQAATGVWVLSVTQQGTHWVVQGEALTSDHAQQLVQQLKALDIWSQPHEKLQLQAQPTVSKTGLPVWQFRIEADLKEAV